MSLDQAAPPKIQVVRDAMVAMGRKKFTAPDIAEATGIDPKEVSIMLAGEASKERLVRVDKGVYRVNGKAYEVHPDAPVSKPAGNGSHTTGAIKLVDPKPRTMEVVADLPEGPLLRAGDGSLWLARRVQLVDG